MYIKAREIITCEPAVQAFIAVPSFLFLFQVFLFLFQAFFFLFQVFFPVPSFFFCSKFFFCSNPGFKFCFCSNFFSALIFFFVPRFVSVFQVFVLCIALVGHRAVPYSPSLLRFLIKSRSATVKTVSLGCLWLNAPLLPNLSG